MSPMPYGPNAAARASWRRRSGRASGSAELYGGAEKALPQFPRRPDPCFSPTVKGVSRNEALEVVRVEKQKVVARNRREIELAARDRIVLIANRREPGFRATNGEMVTVSKVDREGRIQLEDGRLLPAGYRHFDYGYAVTAHRSQGKTLDAVVILADAMKRDLFYVAASRGREGVRA